MHHQPRLAVGFLDSHRGDCLAGVVADASFGSTASVVTTFGVSSGHVVYFEEGGRIGLRQFNSSLGTVGPMIFVGPF